VDVAHVAVRDERRVLDVQLGRLLLRADADGADPEQRQPGLRPGFRTTATSRRDAWLATAVAIPVYVGACAVPDGGLFRAARFRDVHLYGGFAHSVFAGHVPYRDFFMEYPPGALAVFLPPQLFGSGHYNAAFKTLMTLCGAVTIVVLALLLVGSARRAAGSGPPWDCSPSRRSRSGRSRSTLTTRGRRS
jgi:hypothetical protein